MTPTIRVCMFLVHVAAVAGMRVTGGGGVSFPPELLEQLAALTTDKSLPKLLERVPPDMRPMVERFAPMIGKNPALLEAVVRQMPNEQQTKIQELVDVAAGDGTLKDASTLGTVTGSLQKATVQHQGTHPTEMDKQANLVGFVEELAQQVVPTVKEHMNDPGFMNKVVGAVAQDGDNLKDLLGVLLGPDHAALLDPLIKFMSVGGTSVFDSLDRQASPTYKADLMDGPLRIIFLVSNLLAYSTMTGEGSVFSQTEQEGRRAYPVVNRELQEQQVKWLLPEKWMQGIDLICSVLKLKLIALQLQQDELLPAADGSSPTTLYTVRMTLESASEAGPLSESQTGQRSMVVHNVRTTTSTDPMNDLTLIMGLYEKPIRESLGPAKYLSLADVLYKLGQNLARWDWLMEKLGTEGDENVQFLAKLDEQRKSARERLAESVRVSTDALKLHDAKNTVHLFIGVSFGGAIAQIQGMVAKLKCEACPVVALTINSPSVYHIVHKLRLAPEDQRGLLDKMFSDSLLKQKSYLFSGFVNFVAQHGTIWKLDTALPGSKVCMYMHAAEGQGCRGMTNFGDLYRRAYDAFWHCKKDFIKVGEGYSLDGCMKQQLARTLGCMLHEHSFMLGGGLDAKAMIASPGPGAFNMTSAFTDLATIFSATSVSSRDQTIDSLQKETGFTRAVAVPQEEADQRNAMREALKRTAAQKIINAQAVVSALIDPQVQQVERDWASLPRCDGCEEAWCQVSDIREHRCCDHDDQGKCKNAPAGRSACDGSNGETCSGVKRFFENGGRKCKCVKGTCWDGQACKQDASYQRRIDLSKERIELPHRKELLKTLEAFRANEEIAEWEEYVVKMKTPQNTFVDASPDPQIDGTWLCSQ